MENTAAPTFTGQQAATAQTALRKALGLPPEQFPLQAFVGMVSDEIEQLRKAGKTDSEIAALIEGSIGVAVAPTAITDFYASPEECGHHGG
jgi:hypothetical protein